MNDITPEELKSRLEKGETLPLFDVREDWEYDESNIGAELMPLASIPLRLKELEPLKTKEVIVHCKSGSRSHQAKKYLSKHGFRQVRSLIGGIEAYLNNQK